MEQVIKKYRPIITGSVLPMIPKIIAIKRPDGYDSTRYELLIRLFEAQPGKRTSTIILYSAKCQIEKRILITVVDFQLDMIGMNHHYPEANYKERTRIIKEHEAYTKGTTLFL